MDVFPIHNFVLSGTGHLENISVASNAAFPMLTHFII